MLRFQYSKWHNHFYRKNGLVKCVLPMPLLISDGQGSGTTVAIPINENTKISNIENIQLKSNEWQRPDKI